MSGLIRTAIACLAAALFLSSLDAAGDATGPTAIVGRALKVQTDLDQLAGIQATAWKGKGTIELNGASLTFSAQFTVAGPDRYRVEADGDIFRYILVANGAHGWIKINEETQEMEGERVAEEREQAYVLWLSTLAPLRGTGLTLREVGRATVGDLRVLGLAVDSKGHREVKLFFDEQTGRLVMNQMRAKRRGKPGVQEMLFVDYQPRGSWVDPRRLSIRFNGKPFIDMELSDVQHLRQVDLKTFEKP